MMRGQALLLLGILAGLAAGLKDEAPFDLFILTWTYSPGFCKKEECTKPPVSAFTLHGLWPEFEDGGYPQYCETANASGPLPPDTDEMRCKWASFKGPNAKFWKHEWDKHGTCAEPVLGSRPNYFKTVLELDDKYDLDVALAAHDVTPSDTHSYATDDLLDAVSASYGASPMLKCGPKNTLLELWMCISLDLEAIPCPPRVHVNSPCRGTVKLLEGEPVEAACSKYFPPPPGQASKVDDLVHVASAGGAVAGGHDTSSIGAGVQAEE